MTISKKEQFTRECYEYYNKNISDISNNLYYQHKENHNDRIKFSEIDILDVHLDEYQIVIKNAGRNDAIDAFRHAYVSGGFTMEYGETVANILGHAHEIRNDINVYDKHSDKDNYEELTAHFEKEKTWIFGTTP